jgi:hypothetical protein
MLAPLKETSIVNALIARICRHVTALPVPSLPFFTLKTASKKRQRHQPPLLLNLPVAAFVEVEKVAVTREQPGEHVLAQLRGRLAVLLKINRNHATLGAQAMTCCRQYSEAQPYTNMFFLLLCPCRSQNIISGRSRAVTSSIFCNWIRRRHHQIKMTEQAPR